MSFADKLKSLRKEYHMTQEQIAKQLNLNRSTISGYETKDREPSYQTLAEIANFFHVSVDYLLDEDVIIIDNSHTLSSDLEDELLNGYRKLSVESQKKLLEYMKLLTMTETNSEK